MFSRRTNWDLTPNRIATLVEKQGGRLLDLTQSNPTQAGLPLPQSAVLAALGDPRALQYEPSPNGLPIARAAVSDYYRQLHGVEVASDAIVLTASTSEAYSYLLKLLLDPGDAVLVPQPSYPLFEFLAAFECVRVKTYPLVFDGSWSLDLDALKAAATADVRAIVVVSPNNPTGSFLKARELEALRALGRPILCDEVFVDYTNGEEAARAGTLAAEREILAFALSGLSKVCALPQLKLGWIAVAGPPREREAALARLELIADTYLSVSTPAQLAAAHLLPRVRELQSPIARRIADNRAVAERLVGPDRSAAQLLPAEGGWYLILRLPRTRSEEEWVLALLERDGVLFHPGYFFDFVDEAYVVACLLAPTQVLTGGLERLVERVDG